MGLRVTLFAILYAVSMFALVVAFRVGGLTGAPKSPSAVSAPERDERLEASVLFRLPSVEVEKSDSRGTVRSPANPLN